MRYFVKRLSRPYDFRVLIEAYIYTQRKDFPHSDYAVYYRGLLDVLERFFGVRLDREGITTTTQKVLWMLFNSTVSSLFQITSPWDGYIEDSLLNIKLQECGSYGTAVYRASDVIGEANKTSAQAHRDILNALFAAIFGERLQIITSEELRQAGFDDSREPDFSDYYDNW